MKKLFYSILAIFILSSSAFAQKMGSVTGKISDDAGKPAQGATISLLRSKDSSLAKTALSNSKGEYEINGVKAGSYFLSVTSVGFKKSNGLAFEVSDAAEVAAKDISLAASSGSLAEVSVVAKKPMIEVRADKTIFNVESSINATGSNAFELLQKSPGVSTDRDDNISLKGKNGVRIYIDGKPSQFGTKDLADFLRSMNSADIEAIEMISNPSAKYDASGNAGIINIRLKKNKKFGANGSVTAGFTHGKTAKSNNSASLNYRNKKVNLFSNYSNYFGIRESYINIYRMQADTIYDQHTKNFNNGNSHNIKAGADYFIDNKSTFGFIVNANLNEATNSSDGKTVISPMSSKIPSKILYATNNIPGKRTNLNFNVNYRYADTSGHELNLDADRGTFRGTGRSYQPNQYRTPSTDVLLEERIYRNNTPIDIDITTVKIDYETPFKNGVLGIGGKYSKVNTNNVFDFYNVIGGNNNIDSNRSNKFNYSENVNALYINYNRQLGKQWSLQSGVRMENTSSEGNLISFHKQADDNVKRNYTNLFPSAALTYTINQKHSFNLTYSRRIDRPSYQDLNPFENKLDELTYQKGNAFLRPQYTNSVELTHTFLSRFNTTLGYSFIKDYRAQIIDTADKNRSFITQRNLASQRLYNINISAPFSIKKWWNIFVNFNGNHSEYKADFGVGRQINISASAFNIYAQQTFSFKDGLTFETSGWFNSPSIWGGTFKNKAMGGMDIGLQKTLFKGKGNVKFSYTDVLETLRWRGISDFGGTYSDASGGWESNTFRMNLSYRFGNNQVKAARQRKLSSEEENKRLNGSGGLGGN